MSEDDTILQAADFLKRPAADTPLPHVRALQLSGDVTLPFCWVPPGSLRIGSRDRYPDERPAAKVREERGFWLGQTAVTRQQWRAVMGSVPDILFGAAERQEQHPVVEINWFEALRFCLKLQETHFPKQPAPVTLGTALDEDPPNCRAVNWTDAPGFRLPSESEWGYACRGAGKTCRGMMQRPFGDGEEVLLREAWILDTSGQSTHPVDSSPEGSTPQPLGLRQLIGNVQEWTLDLYYDQRYPWMEHRADGFAHGNHRAVPFTPSKKVDVDLWLSAYNEGRLDEANMRATAAILERGGPPLLQQKLDQKFKVNLPLRVLRGGSWNFPAVNATASFRDRGPAVDRGRYGGFRVCLSPRPAASDTEAGPERQAEPGGARSGADAQAGHSPRSGGKI